MKTLFLWLVLSLLTTPLTHAQETESCSGSLPSRLTSGNQAVVVSDSPLTVRDLPDGSRRLGDVALDSAVTLLDGPVCGSLRQFNWWRIRLDDTEGWIAEGNAVEYWLEPAADWLPVTIINSHGELPVGELVKGTTSGGAREIWTFPADQGDMLMFTIPSAEDITWLQFSDSADTVMTVGDMAGGGKGNSSQVLFVAPETDSFTVAVYNSYTFDTGVASAYQLQMDRVNPQDDHLLTFPAAVRGELTAATPLFNYELWAFDGVENGVAVLTVASIGDAYSAPLLLLIDAQANPLLVGVEGAEITQTKLGFRMENKRYYALVRFRYNETPGYTLNLGLGTEDDIVSETFADFIGGMG